MSVKNIFAKIKELIKKYKKTSIISGLIIIALIAFFIVRINKKTEENTVKAEIGTVKQEISVVGRVKASQAVDLSFDRSGRLTFLEVKSGNRVFQGQLLAQLDLAELLAQRQREIANINAAEQRLNQILATTNTSQTSNNDTANILSKSLKTAIDAMVDFTTIQYSYFNNQTSEATILSNAKEETLHAIYGQTNLGLVQSWYFLPLNTGLKAEVMKVENNPEVIDNYEPLITKVKEVLLKTKINMEILQAQLNGIINADSNDIITVKTDIDSLISQISNLANENKSLVSESYDIEIAKAQLDQTKASLALIDAQVAKNSIWAPFNGIVTEVNIEKGEIVSGGLAISMIGLGRNEIEVNVSEADIAKIKKGDQAAITFDAYSSDQKFKATVTNIDPAARISEGVATFKITLQFTENDKKIMPGLTADIDILTEQKENVLYIPSREIITKDGKKYAKLAVDTNNNDVRFANLSPLENPGSKKTKVYEVEIQTGLKGSDGRTEITFGLKEGDKILVE